MLYDTANEGQALTGTTTTTTQHSTYYVLTHVLKTENKVMGSLGREKRGHGVYVFSAEKAPNNAERVNGILLYIICCLLAENPVTVLLIYLV